MNLNQLIALFSTSFILFSCAQIRPLTGGGKDISAPIEVESTPKNGSINFNEKIITIEFNEFIKITNVSTQLIVSPLMETPPEILVKGKKLVIKLKNELVVNTTYSLNFGNAISDITENNIFPNYKYVFSTGSYIDSLSYSGTVVNAFDLSKTENIYALLYDQLEDSVPYKKLPRYVAITDKEGKFSITNIANGKYKFFAIDDINGNYLFDLPNETIGFKNVTVRLDSNSSDNIVYLFEEESDLQYVVNAEHKEFGKIDIVLNLPTENLRIDPINITLPEFWFFDERNMRGDSITMWLNAVKNIDVLEFSIADGEEIIDTIEIKLIKEIEDSSLQVFTNLSANFDLDKNIVLNTNRPINDYNAENIHLYADSILVQDTMSFSQIMLGLKSARTIAIEYILKENTSHQLFIPSGAIQDIYGLKSDTVKIDFKTKSESDYGIINLSISPNFSDNYIVQLYKNNKLIKESYFKNKIETAYKYLLPGFYELKLIIDRNKDEKWNTGNYLEGIQPEKVIFYEKEIKIRANWNNDIIWTINE